MQVVPLALFVLRYRQQPWLRLQNHGKMIRATTRSVPLPLYTHHHASSSSSSSTNKTTRLRLQPLLDLAIQYGSGGSVVDVGTDHGLLAVALARATASKQQQPCFTHVTGVDRSLAALEQGAYALMEQQQQTTTNRLRLSFQHGDGIQCLQQTGAADTVCIAGMGVHSMLRILQPSSPAHTVQRLILQPTNSRPKNLMLLYESLCDTNHEDGSGSWMVQEERIDYLASRWYWTTLFVRTDAEGTPKGNTSNGGTEPQWQHPFPGCCLKTRRQEDENATYRAWVAHHCLWIQQTHPLDASSSSCNEHERCWCQHCCGDAALATKQ